MAMPPRREIIQRVFAITANQSSIGSAFAYPANGSLYFITAAHVLGDMPHGQKYILEIYRDNKWQKTEATPFYMQNRPWKKGDIDIAVVKTSLTAEQSEVPPLLSSAGTIVGQDVYFLGFPYFGQSIQYPAEPINNNFPLPLVKKAIVSGFRESIIYLDGHNNPGFSGGPVIFWDESEKKNKIIGVISSYITQSGNIEKINTSTEEFYRENSGIIIAYDINAIEHLIQKIDNSSEK